MSAIPINKLQLDALIRKNMFRVEPKTERQSVCSDAASTHGRALSLPGGDGGELSALLSAGREYGFEVDLMLAKKAIESVSGEALTAHTAGCAYMHNLLKEPSKLNVDPDDESALQNLLRVDDTGGPSYPFVAVLFVSGAYGIEPLYEMEYEEKGRTVEVLVYHQSLAKARHRLIAKELVESGAVKLYNGLDSEYLYEVWDAQVEDHFYSHAGIIAKTCPVYEVNFDDDGAYKLTDLGYVPE